MNHQRAANVKFRRHRRCGFRPYAPEPAPDKGIRGTLRRMRIAACITGRSAVPRGPNILVSGPRG